MVGRLLLIPAVVAAAGGLFLAQQTGTQAAQLNTTAVSRHASAAYLDRARVEAPELWAADDLLLIRAGVGLCGVIEQAPDAEVVPRPVDGLTDREMRVITTASTRHLCPGQRSRVATYLSTKGSQP
ncbi:hypothetical protein [Actinomadura sp. WMMA1423]|uniref:hypothetical protein n=1 Tax=Actinomadura sp. WMMA1423 TaxID=2591108 RepID=UPI0011463FE5|nr:hypothetical protein [Actinomadura sp. WMMA1423]